MPDVACGTVHGIIALWNEASPQTHSHKTHVCDKQRLEDVPLELQEQ